MLAVVVARRADLVGPEGHAPPAARAEAALAVAAGVAAAVGELGFVTDPAGRRPRPGGVGGLRLLPQLLHLVLVHLELLMQLPVGGGGVRSETGTLRTDRKWGWEAPPSTGEGEEQHPGPSHQRT